MKCLSTILLFLAVVGTGGEMLSTKIPSKAKYSGSPSGPSNEICTHQRILLRLTNLYGVDSCTETVGETTGRLECSVSLFAYNTRAEYSWEIRIDGEVPTGLGVTSGHYNETDGSFLHGGARKDNFQYSDCVNESVEEYMSSIAGDIGQRACQNIPGSHPYKKGQSLTCLELAGFPYMRRKKICQKFPNIAYRCQGICKKNEYCQCKDNPVAFPLNANRELMCSKLMEMSDKKRNRMCSKNKIKRNCPAVCGTGVCSISTNSNSNRIVSSIHDSFIVVYIRKPASSK